MPEHADWPRWATESLVLSAPNTGWALQSETLSRELARSLGGHLLEGPVHVGSTAVPDLIAKPIIDLMAAVQNFEAIRDIEAELSAEDWHFVPASLDQRPWRRFFVKVKDDRRVAHLQLMQRKDPHWQAQLAFRDALRADPELRGRYARLKQQLCVTHGDDRESYSHAKSAFVQRALSAHAALDR